MKSKFHELRAMDSIREKGLAKEEALLRQLSFLHGVEHDYTDGTGARRQVPLKTLRHILESMGVRCDTLAGMRRAFADEKVRSWKTILDEVVIVRPSHKPPSIVVSLPLQFHLVKHLSFILSICDEKGKTRKLRRHGSSCKLINSITIQRNRYIRIQVPLPQRLSYGYFQLSIIASIGSRCIKGKALLISAPPQCYLPAYPRRSWGITLQLYSLRSETNWGVGDFRDLGHIMKWAGGKFGAATIGISPLHPLPTGLISPYSPSSRLFVNPLYLNVEGIAEYGSTLSIQRRIRSRPFQKRLSELRDSPMIQYEAVLALKLEILEVLYKAFTQQHAKRMTRRSRAFSTYIQKGGASLDRFAVFQALTEFCQTSRWRQWPHEFHNPNSPAVDRFREIHHERIRFFQYIQWQCELQIQGLDRVTQRNNMPLGLYHDLPVGIHPEGADAWVFQEQLAQAVTVGAPPDSFNVTGQDWGLMAPILMRMRSDGYRFFIETMRQNMRHGGLLRIDHALGLFRLFWIPEGCSAEEGAYVRTREDELLAILALESVKNRVMVIGEDLGTVTPVIRNGLAQAGLLSYRLLLFEKTSGNAFRSPAKFPQQAVVAATTHDLPTLRGFWRGRDIQIKEQAGLYLSSEQSVQDRNIRVGERVALLKALKSEGLLKSSSSNRILPHMTDEQRASIYAFLARTPCRVLVVTLEDLLGEQEAPNLPGASQEVYPSWRLKVAKSLNSWKDDPAIHHIVRMIREYR